MYFKQLLLAAGGGWVIRFEVPIQNLTNQILEYQCRRTCPPCGSLLSPVSIGATDFPALCLSADSAICA